MEYTFTILAPADAITVLRHYEQHYVQSAESRAARKSDPFPRWPAEAYTPEIQHALARLRDLRR